MSNIIFTVDAGVVLLSLFVVGALFAVYFMRKGFMANNQTCAERRAIINFYAFMRKYDRELSEKISDEYNSVAYETHMDYIKRHGSARCLYPILLQTYNGLLK